MAQPQWRDFRWDAFWMQIGSARWGWIALGCTVVYSSYWIRGERWRVLMRPLKPNPSRPFLVVSNIVGFAAIAIIGRPAEAVRPLLVARRERVSIAGQFAVLFVERLLDTLALVAITGAALALVSDAEPIRQAGLSGWMETAGWVMAAGGIGTLLALFALPRVLSAALRWLIPPDSAMSGWRGRVAHAAAQFTLGTQALTNPRDAALCFFWTAGEWFVVSVTYWCVLVGCLGGRFLAFDELLLFIGLVSLASAIQIPGVGGGLQLTTIWILETILGAPPEQAAGAGLLMWVVVMLSAIPGALVAVLSPSIRRTFLRENKSVG